MTEPTCERPGCRLPAAYYRWKADPGSRGANLNEPGVKKELLCIAHANEVRMYLGSNPVRLPEAES